MTDIETIRKMEALRQELKLMRQLISVNELWPGPPPLKPRATMSLLERIFDNSETAMVFSNSLSKAFKETGIEFKDDETFACMLCVVKKPKYISEVMGLHPEPSVMDPTPEPAMVPKMAYSDTSMDDFPFGELVASACRSIRYNKIMEPAIMKKITKRKDQDKINY